MLFCSLLLAGLLGEATPLPSPTNQCAHEAIVVTPVKPQIEGLSRDDLANSSGTVDIKVVVEADGSARASIERSSGYLALDMAVLRAAKASTYEPKTVDCKPVEGTYIFRFSAFSGTP